MVTGTDNSEGRRSTDSLIIRLLAELNDKMGLMVDVIEKHPRSGVPNSMYFNARRYADAPKIERTGLTRYESLSNSDRQRVVDEYADDINTSDSRAAKGIRAIREILESGEKDGVELDRLARREMRRKLKAVEDEFVREKHNQKVEENLQKLKEYGYKNKEAYLKHEQVIEAYEFRTAERRDVTNQIAHSGLGNTKLGRAAQSLISTRQRADDIVNFGFGLKNGGSEKMATALFGDGAVAKGASKALSGFGSALTKLGGPIAGISYGFKIAWAAAETFAKVVNAANAYINRNIKLQTNLNQLMFDRDVALMQQDTESRLETIKYIGDLQLKQMEIQSENLKQGVEIATKSFVTSVETAVGPLVNGINETAYNAASKKLELQADAIKYGLDVGLREQQYKLFADRRQTEYENAYANIREESNLTRTKYEADAYLNATKTTLEQHKDWAGRLASSDAANATLDALSSTAVVIGAPGTGMIVRGIHGSPGQAEEQREQMEESSSSVMLPSGHPTQTREDVLSYGENPARNAKVSKVRLNPLWGGIGYDVAESIAEQMVQPEVFEAEWKKAAQQAVSNLTNTTAGYEERAGNIKAETAKAVAEIEINAALEVRKTFLELAKKTESWVEEFDKMSNDLAINLGFTARNALRGYQDSLLSTLEDTVSKFGKDREDMMKVQQAYAENTGRQKLLSDSDYGQLFGLGKYLGDDGLAAQFASEMEIFNTGAAQSVDLLDSALQDVNRIGLNGRKFAKDITNNLKMAQKYNFKGGVKGFMDMAKWAEKTRFNISSLGGMLDKVQEGGIEGIIKQSAEFQVLGGHAAMNSDPLGMMFDAWADPEAFAKRMQDMTSGFGTVDSKTGETKFNINESMQMAQIAKIQGRSVEDVRAEVMDRNRRQAAINSLTAEQRNGMTQEQLDYLGSTAEYNKETGKFEVKVKEGNKYVSKSIDEVAPEKLGDIMPEKHDERMEVYMQDILTMLEGVSGEEIAERANAAAATMESIINEYAERTRIAHESYAENRDKYIAEIINGSKLATDAFSDFIGVFNQGNEDLAAQEARINEQATRVSDAIGGVADTINEARAQLRAELNASSVFGFDMPLNDYANIARRRNDAAHGRDINDGIVSGKNEEMLVGAQNIVPINDGSLKFAKPNKNDWGYFAKEGGPLGEGMNNISNEIGTVSEAVSNVLPDTLGMLNEMWSDPSEKLMGTLMEMTDSYKPTIERPQSGKRDINVNINGKLMLDGGGQQVDILHILKTNPDLTRKVTEIIINQMSSNENGGKYEMYSNRYYR